MTETWRPVPGYIGRYEVSDHGNVRSLTRLVTDKHGRPYTLRGRVLKQSRSGDKKPRQGVTLTAEGVQTRYLVHRLVLAAFVGPCPEGQETLHADDNPENNHLDNLRYGTRSENMQDKIANGLHHYANRSHCKNGHEFTPENTVIRKGGGRWCRECGRERSREYMRRKRGNMG